MSCCIRRWDFVRVRRALLLVRHGLFYVCAKQTSNVNNNEVQVQVQSEVLVLVLGRMECKNAGKEKYPYKIMISYVSPSPTSIHPPFVFTLARRPAHALLYNIYCRAYSTIDTKAVPYHSTPQKQ